MFSNIENCIYIILKPGVIEKLPIPVSSEFIAELTGRRQSKIFKYIQINRLRVVGWLLNYQRRTPVVAALPGLCQPI